MIASLRSQEHPPASTGEQLRVLDLQVKYGFIDSRDYKVQWSSFDNDSEEHAIIDGAISVTLPGRVKQAKNSSYFAATITGEDEAKTVTVYVRKEGSAVKIIGIDRSW